MYMKSISRQLIDIDTMSIKLVVSIDKGKSYSIYETSTGSYGSLSFKSSVVMQYKAQVWHRTNSVYINNKNIFRLKTDLRNFYNNILQNEDTFAYDSKTDEVVQVDRSSDTKAVIYLGNSQYIAIQPDIIYDKENHPLPGVSMCINIQSNNTNMSIDEFESILDLFETMNITTDSMLLFNSYLLLNNESPNNDQSTHPKNSNKKPVLTGSVFQKPLVRETDNESVTGTMIKNPPTSLNQI